MPPPEKDNNELCRERRNEDKENLDNVKGGFGSSGARAETEVEVAGRLFYSSSNQVLPTYFQSGAKRERAAHLSREEKS